jgi:hypothetical protein
MRLGFSLALTQPRGGAPPPPPPANAVVKGFTDAAYLDAAAVGPAFGPGKSIAVAVRREAPAVASDVVWGFSGPTDGTGWYLYASGTWQLSLDGVGYIDTGISANDAAGTLATLAITWLAAGGLRISRNGAAVVSVAAAVGYTPPGGSSVHRIGRWQQAGWPADGLAVAALSAWDGELSDAQLQAVYGTGYDTLHPAGAPTRLLHWHAGRDWDGAAPTSTSGGTAPATYTVVGAPTREVIP